MACGEGVICPAVNGRWDMVCREGMSKGWAGHVLDQGRKCCEWKIWHVVDEVCDMLGKE